LPKPGGESPSAEMHAGSSAASTRLESWDYLLLDASFFRYHAGAAVLAADGDDDGAIHGDDVNRAFRAAFVGVVARWSSRCRVVVGDVPGRRRHGGAGLRTCEDAA